MTDTPWTRAQQPLYQDMLCDMVAEGEYLNKSCVALGVDVMSVYKLLRKGGEFAEKMEAAREAGADKQAEHLAEISDDDGFDVVNRAAVKRHELRIKTRQWLLEKWHPKRYGPRVQVETKTATVAIPVGDDPIAAARAYEDLMKG